MKHQIKLISLLFFLIFCGACKKKRDLSVYQASSKDSFALVFLSNLEGYVAPCGCTSNPLGGIDRFAQIFNDLKIATHNRLALIDTGNLLFDSSSRHQADLCQDNARLDLLLSTLKDLGLRLTLARHFDNARGEGFRDSIYKKYDLSILKKPQIIKAGDFDIALIPIDSSFLSTSFSNSIKNLKENKHIKAIIGISLLALKETIRVLNDYRDIDVVIQAEQSALDIPPPKKLGTQGPILFQGGRQGQYITLLMMQNFSERTNQQAIQLDDRAFLRKEQLGLVSTRLEALESQIKNAQGPRKEFISQRIIMAKKELDKLKIEEKTPPKPLSGPNIVFQAIALTKQVDPFVAVKAKLEAYEKSIPALNATCEASIECPRPLPGEATYVGVESCKVCHQQAYDTWQKAVYLGSGKDESGHAIKRRVGHSKAWATLQEAGKDHDRSCIGCHSIGFMQPGGYCKASEVDFRKDVQCESCHGPGSLHAQSGDKKFIKRKVSEETCRGCHHVPHIKSYDSFNYDQQVMRILGPGHGEKLLQELRHKSETHNSQN